MKKYKNIEIIKENGLKCDNPKCDWEDDSIKFDTYKEWINKLCPKCGENVLTEEDFKNSELIRNAIDTHKGIKITENKDNEGCIIEFNIGPSDETTYNTVLKYIENTKDITILNISDKGDHYREILVKGDYNKHYPYLSSLKISLEHWEE